MAPGMGDWDRMEFMQTTWPCCSSSIRGRKAFVVWDEPRKRGQMEEENKDEVKGSVEIEGEIYSVESRKRADKSRLKFNFHLFDNGVSLCI